MILVAGLAVAGLAGIAAAFYFSVRPGRPRMRPAGSGRAGAGRLATGRNGSARSTPARPAGSAGRLVGWRKGSEIDEELWPTAAFGGVSDEQFWDDMAADKPLATTARTAQADSGATRRPRDGRGNPPDGRGGATPPVPRNGDDGTAAQPVPAAAQSAPASAQPHPAAAQAYPAVAQAYPAVAQAYPAVAQPSSTAVRPVRAAYQPVGSGGRAARISPDEDPLTSPAYSLRPRASTNDLSYPPRRSRDLSPGQYQAAISQETQAFSLAEAQAAGGYAGTRAEGRQDLLRADPLRPDRPRPDGHRTDAYRAAGRSDPLRSTGSWPGSSAAARTVATPVYQQGPASSEAYRGTAAYPYPAPAYGEPGPASTPPYGEAYGYRSPVSPAGPFGSFGPDGLADDTRRPDGSSSSWRHGQPGAQGPAGGDWAARPAYPPGNGYRSPYDPR